MKCLIYKKLFKKLSNVEIEVRMSALQFFFFLGGGGKEDWGCNTPTYV